jgi:tRNA threonylcarbamoyladenosine biosynthesis protein TsaE
MNPAPTTHQPLLPHLHSVDFVSHSAEQTLRTGQRLGELARAGDLFLLAGNLGSGKTCLTQGIAQGLGIRVPVTSPSFTLINEYTTRECGARLCLYHADLYRLVHADEEALDLGLEEYLYGSGVCVIEWSERAGRLWPAEHLTVRLEYISESKRGVRLEPTGERYIELVQEFRKRAFGL